MRCLGCQYDLKNLAEHRCPECGRTFDPNDPETFDSGLLKPSDTWLLWIGLALCAFVGFMLAAAMIKAVYDGINC